MVDDRPGDPGQQDAVSSVAGGVPQTVEIRLPAHDGQSVGGAGAEPGPCPQDLRSLERRDQQGRALTDRGDAALGDLGDKPGVFYRRPGDPLATAVEQVAALPEHD